MEGFAETAAADRGTKSPSTTDICNVVHPGPVDGGELDASRTGGVTNPAINACLSQSVPWERHPLFFRFSLRSDWRHGCGTPGLFWGRMSRHYLTVQSGPHSGVMGLT